jgi:hypothetical protein
MESISPLDYARQKVADGKWVELWYFTKQGCFEASKHSTSIADDTFGITTSNSTTVHLRSASSTTASCFAKPDTDLNWDQITFAGKILIKTAEQEYWPPEHVDALVGFFMGMDYECTNLGYDGDHALIEYQASVRKEWHRTLNTHHAFDIAEFNHQRFFRI